MLEQLSIRNFALIERADIDFERGMTALTGETGAGKSILLDAIGLVLGDRADADSVKSGADKAEISARFDLREQPEARVWLQQQELDDSGECLLRRVVQAGGRSRAWINGSAVTLGQMRELGEMLVDVHGQHEHQSLQKPSVQRDLLDRAGELEAARSRVAGAHHHWRDATTRLEQARDQSADKQQRIELLQLYLRELDELALKPGEAAELRAEHHRAAHAGQILETGSEVLGRLYENESSIQTELAGCLRALDELRQLDAGVAEQHDLLSSALIQVEEAASGLRGHLDGIDADPARLEWLNARLSQIQSLARKHRVEEDALPQLAETLREEYESLTLDESGIEALEQAAETAREDYLKAARALSSERRRAAAELSARISEVMQSLGMEGGRFEIEVSPQEEAAQWGPQGLDRIVFLVSANPGQPPKPLTRVASGGELSRISLAIQVILSEANRIPTLIFDEVDSGVGGGIAEIVGRLLRQIAAERQIFCVTHLPQVAAQAHHHYRVSKEKREQTTHTRLERLQPEQRVEEIARMLGGVDITEQSRAHAREMIAGTLAEAG
jgi:DNA repair protein RecN (Recombination protein N)